MVLAATPSERFAQPWTIANSDQLNTGEVHAVLCLAQLQEATGLFIDPEFHVTKNHLTM